MSDTPQTHPPAPVVFNPDSLDARLSAILAHQENQTAMLIQDRESRKKERAEDVKRWGEQHKDHEKRIRSLETSRLIATGGLAGLATFWKDLKAIFAA